MNEGFSNRPSGTITGRDATATLDAARVVVADLRRDLGELHSLIVAGRAQGGLLEVDLRRALIALGSADLALGRGRRHAELEP